MARLQGRTAIVTGGGKGLGRHYSEALAREGATVAILDIANCDATAAAINDTVGRHACIGLSTDVSDEESIKARML